MTDGTVSSVLRLDAADGPAGVADPRVKALERAVAARLRVRDVVAVASATVAFHLVYRALGLPGSARVLTSPVADPSVVRAALALGLAPRFADVDGRGHLDPATIARHVQLHGMPAVIVPGHLRGHPCDVAGIAAGASGAVIVEDATEAFGAVAPDGRPVGAGGAARASILGLPASAHPLPSNGALITTDDGAVAAACRRLREERSEYRLSELHATLALVYLGRVAAVIAERAQCAARYDAVLAAHPLATPIAPPDGTRSAWSAYGVRVPPWLRGELVDLLRAEGVRARRLPVLLHRHPYLGRDADVLPGELPGAERLAAELLVLPTAGAMAGDATWMGRPRAEPTREHDRVPVAG